MAGEAAEGERKKGGFPAPITILLAVLLAVWIAAFFIPAGEFQRDENGSPIAGRYSRIDPPLDTAGRVRDLLLAPVNGLGEAEIARNFIRGVVDFTGPAFLVTVARGISVVLTNTKTIDTVLNSMEGLVAGTSSMVFTALTFAVSLPLAFLIGAGSAGTALVMPIFAPLGDFTGVDRSLVLAARTAAGGWLVLILPTNALLIAGLALARVGYDQYLKFMLPLMAILLVVCLGVLGLRTLL
jgi:uncharacterized ion transporter superfamily protein YfcC